MASAPAGGLLLVFALWWRYFAPAHTLLATSHQAHRRRFTWAYGHYPILVSAAAEGAGLAVCAQLITGRTGAPPLSAGGAVTVPAAVFLITVWAVHVRPHRRSWVEQLAFSAVAVAVLMAARSPTPALLAALAAALVVVVTLVDRAERLRGEGP